MLDLILKALMLIVWILTIAGAQSAYQAISEFYPNTPYVSPLVLGLSASVLYLVTIFWLSKK